METKLLVKYQEDYGRMGDLDELFICTADELAALKEVKEVYWSEKLGKHSEGSYTFDDTTLTVLTDDQQFIQKAIDLGVLSDDLPDFFAQALDDTVESMSEDEYGQYRLASKSLTNALKAKNPARK